MSENVISTSNNYIIFTLSYTCERCNFTYFWMGETLLISQRLRGIETILRHSIAMNCLEKLRRNLRFAKNISNNTLLTRNVRFRWSITGVSNSIMQLCHLNINLATINNNGNNDIIIINTNNNYYNKINLSTAIKKNKLNSKSQRKSFLRTNRELMEHLTPRVSFLNDTNDTKKKNLLP